MKGIEKLRKSFTQTADNARNIGYIVAESWQIDKTYVKLSACSFLMMVIQPFFLLFITRFTIDEIVGGGRIEVVIALAGGYLVVQGAMSVLLVYADTRLDFFRIIYGFLRKYTEVNFTTDYVNIENPEFLDKSNKARSTIYNVANSVLPHISSFLSSGLTLLGHSIIVITLNPLVIVPLAVSALLLYRYNGKVNDYVFKLQDEISTHERRKDVVNNIMRDFSYGKDIRMFDFSSFLLGKFEDTKVNLIRIFRKTTFKRTTAGLLETVLDFILKAAVYAYLVFLMLDGQATIGEFTMFSGAALMFSASANGFMTNLAGLNDNSKYINVLREFLKLGTKNSKQTDAVLSRPPYGIEFANVSFKYPNSDEYILKNFNLTIKPNERVAIVGKNGAGKSTLIKLLCRLYEPTEGEIKVNGVNILRYDREKYMEVLSAVFQEPVIFAFSMAENVAVCDKDNLDEVLVTQCIKKAGLSKKIESLSAGVHTSVFRIHDENGIEPSGGEKQKMSLARALYKNGNIIILDEPSAALDPIAEYEMYKSFDSVAGGKTAIYVSHRLASTRFCDVIVYIEDGAVVEYGSHEDLLKSGGKYAEMFDTQSKYYKEGSADDE